MEQMKHMKHQYSLRYYAVTVLFLLFVCGVSPQAVRAQWTTSGNNISNTNPGNVGVGTAAPSTKLDIIGTAKAESLSVGGAAAEKTFTLYWSNDVANQKVQVYWPASTQVDGIFEITVTGHYWNSNTNGGIRKRIVINGRNIGIINMQEAEVPFRLGYTGSSNTISNIMWDAANSRYYFIVSNLDNKQNGITVHVKSITPLATPANADNLNVTPIYTTDTTVYPQLYASLMSGNVGIGTATPGYRLDVQGGALNASGGLCIAGDCKTAWSQVSGAGSQWTTSASNIFYNTGNVGIGTTTPIDRFHVESGVNDMGLFLRNSLTSANATNRISFANGTATATAIIESVKVSSGSVATDLKFWVHNGASWNYPLYLKNNGNVGIGTTLPNYKLDVSGEINATGLRINGTPVGSGPWSTGSGNVYYNTGNVGIGTSAPASLLQVGNGALAGTMALPGINVANGNSSYVSVDNGTIKFFMGADISAHGIVGTYTNHPIAFRTGNVERMRIDTTGNVGIGVASPATKLDVAGQVRSSSGGFVFPDGTVQATAATGGGSVAASNVTQGQFGAGNYIFPGNVDINGTLTWGTNDSRTEWKDDAGAIASKSGFFETSNPVNYPAGATTWWHLIESRHNNPNNNYALQIAGSFFDQNLYVRKTNVSTATTATTAAAPWSKFVLQDSDGNTAIGASPSSTLNVQGNITVSGNINAKYQDVAEWVESSQKLEAGTVVALDPEKSNQVLASTEAYDTKVAGVISAQPGISLGERSESKVLVATTGRVKVKVDATRAPIKIGDLLVTSDVQGVAMKSEPFSVGGRRMHSPGTIIGKALEPLASGTGTILVLLSLQ